MKKGEKIDKKYKIIKTVLRKKITRFSLLSKLKISLFKYIINKNNKITFKKKINALIRTPKN